MSSYQCDRTLIAHATTQIGGIVLFLMYIAQCTLGYYVHARKHVHARKPRERGGQHPPRNILHIIFGLATLGIAFWQVRTSNIWTTTTSLMRSSQTRTGLTIEYRKVSGASPPPFLADLWIIWVAVGRISSIHPTLF